MFDLFNVNDEKGLTVFEIENGIVDMTQTGDVFDRSKMFIAYFCSVLNVKRLIVLHCNISLGVYVYKKLKVCFRHPKDFLTLFWSGCSY